MPNQKRTSRKGTDSNTWQRVDAEASVTRAPAWSRFKDEQLLDVPICALGLSIEDNPRLVQMRDQLYGEISSRGLSIKPHAWLSDDWFVPDGIPGIAIPFYMASPRPVSYTHLTLPTKA